VVVAAAGAGPGGVTEWGPSRPSWWVVLPVFFPLGVWLSRRWGVTFDGVWGAAVAAVVLFALWEWCGDGRR